MLLELIKVEQVWFNDLPNARSWAFQVVYAAPVPLETIVQRIPVLGSLTSKQTCLCTKTEKLLVLTRFHAVRQRLGHHDADIAPTKTMVSLVCPISMTRLVRPCRSSQCTHSSCFDALSYITVCPNPFREFCALCSSLSLMDFIIFVDE